jgi:hypothetical protein
MTCILIIPGVECLRIVNSKMSLNPFWASSKFHYFGVVLELLVVG